MKKEFQEGIGVSGTFHDPLNMKPYKWSLFECQIFIFIFFPFTLPFGFVSHLLVKVMVVKGAVFSSSPRDKLIN
ncbi:CLUMA_CG018604, isoform A [Clunio marinus]|uniref:CLUMA_CG018604, isoform A n=1 Tax=Clunio marinus TaxID=568069 RepID=A0A1J1J196_9DIPT|nr:CLUMA_CG018604, isoform A [Clunio marinus]